MTNIKKIAFSLFHSFKNVWQVSRISLIVIILSKIILGFIPLISIWFFEKLFDSITSTVSENTFSYEVILYLVGLAGTAFFAFALNKFIEIIRSVLNYKFEAHMKSKLFNTAKKVPYIRYENSEFQNKIVRAMSGQNNMLSVVDTSTTIVQSVISIVSVLFYLINISMYFLILLFIMVTPLAIIDMIYGKQRFTLTKNLVEKGRKESYYESLLIRRESLKEIRINNLEDYFITKWKNSFIYNSKKKVKLNIRQTKWLVMANIIIFISFVSSGSYVYFLMINGALTIGVLAAVLQAIQRLQSIIPALTSSASSLLEYSLHVNEFIDFMLNKTKSKNDKDNNKDFTTRLTNIKASNLTFRYPGQSKPSLMDINLNIDNNRRIAIIGGNGAGKTTLIKCLTGLYNTQNMVEINNKYDLSEITKEHFWMKISVLFQDFNKYNLTVKENIGNGNMEKIENLGLIKESSELTGINSYIESLPFKYDTMLGKLFKDGEELSGGQWQKLAISRALFKEADIIFLDEPTSALDPKSELFVVQNLLKIAENTGIVYITHRINVAMLADEIVMMDNGKIIEQGSHDELIKLEGTYYNIYNKQVQQLTKERRGIEIG